MDANGNKIEAFVVDDENSKPTSGQPSGVPNGSSRTSSSGSSQSTNYAASQKSQFTVVPDKNGNLHVVPKSSQNGGAQNTQSYNQQSSQSGEVELVEIPGADGKSYWVDKNTLNGITESSSSSSSSSSSASGSASSSASASASASTNSARSPSLAPSQSNGQQQTCSHSKISWEKIVTADGTVMSVPIKTCVNHDGTITAEITYNPSSSKKHLCGKQASGASNVQYLGTSSNQASGSAKTIVSYNGKTFEISENSSGPSSCPCEGGSPTIYIQ